MAKLIIKSPYIKGSGAAGYLKYIGTREGVELLPDGSPPTRKQEQLIEKLTKEFPDTQAMDEFSDYAESKTRYNASQFISRALEENWTTVSGMEGYAGYIATRPRAQRLGSHGLFGDEEAREIIPAVDAARAEGLQVTGPLPPDSVFVRALHDSLVLRTFSNTLKPI